MVIEMWFQVNLPFYNKYEDTLPFWFGKCDDIYDLSVTCRVDAFLLFGGVVRPS